LPLKDVILLLKVANLHKNSFKKPPKKPIFDLFLGNFQKILIKQHISRDLDDYFRFKENKKNKKKPLKKEA